MKYYKLLFLLFNFILLFSSTKSYAKDLDQELYDVFNLVLDEKYDKGLIILSQLDKESTISIDKVKIYSSYVQLYVNEKNYEKSLEYATKIHDISKKTSDKLDDAYYLYVMGQIYLENQLNDKTIESLHKALKILDKYPTEYLLKSSIYSRLSLNYNRSGIYNEDYQKYTALAIENAIKSKNSIQVSVAYTELTMMYYTAYITTNDNKYLKLLFSSTEKTIEYVESNSNTLNSNRLVVMSYNNFASLLNNFPYKNLSDTERYNLAEKYIYKAISLLKNNKHAEMFCVATLGEIQFNKGDYENAEKNLLKGYDIAKNKLINKRISILIDMSNLISLLYEKRGNVEKALLYKSEALKYSQNYFKKSLNDRSKFLEAYYNSEEKNHRIAQLESASKNQKKQTYLFIGIIILTTITIVSLVYLINFRTKLNRQQTKLLEANHQETELTLQLEKKEKARLQYEQDLLKLQQEQLQKTAMTTSLKLEKKNSLINELKQNIKDGSNKAINKLLKEDYLTDNNFDETQKIIQEIHPNFYNKLNSFAKSKLSNLDFKYATYIYLNMDNIQIANILKVEVNTVRMTKYRLKQKIGLQKEDDLASFIQLLINKDKQKEEGGKEND